MLCIGSIGFENQYSFFCTLDKYFKYLGGCS